TVRVLDALAPPLQVPLEVVAEDVHRVLERRAAHPCWSGWVQATLPGQLGDALEHRAHRLAFRRPDVNDLAVGGPRLEAALCRLHLVIENIIHVPCLSATR